MSKTTTVYMVTSGAYSDYRVDGIFSTREIAEEFTKRFQDNYCNGVREVVIDAVAPPEGMDMYQLTMLLDGTAEQCNCRTDPDRYEASDVGTVRFMERSKYPLKPRKDALLVTCWATDEQHAVKIGAERLAEWLYSNPGRVPA